MSSVYYVDGNFLEADEAVLPINDLAILRGYGVFDFFRTYGGKPIQLQRNIARLRSSAHTIRIDLPWSDDDIRRVVMATIDANSLDEAGVRIVVTGGASGNFLMPDDVPRLLVYVDPLKLMPQIWYTDGVKVCTVQQERYLPRAKSLNYTPAILALKDAAASGAVEAVYVDREHNVREGTTTNLFAFFGESTVVTPETDILPGITRGRVSEILRRAYTLEERALSYDELIAADEVVMTSSNKEVVPVVQVDGHVYGDGKPGEHSRRLTQNFQAYVAEQVRLRDADRHV
jgi:branched-chain amino acid aminotransferase